MSGSFNYEAWEAEQTGRSYEMVREIQKNWRKMYAGRKKGFEIALFVATTLGTRQLTALFASGPHIIVLCVHDEREGGEIVYAPVEQCVFSLRHFQPTDDQPGIILGFAPPKRLM
jgi:hypothetical protein